MPNARLVSITPNYKELLCLACSKPYGNDVTMKGIQCIIKSGHLSILEHCYASFEVNCSCRVLGQITRHRHLSFTVQSTRGHMISEFQHPTGSKRISNIVIKNTECAQPYLDKIAQPYLDKILEGYNFEDAAYYAPQGAMTSMVVTGNFRAWYEYLPKRLCQRAMREHRKLAKQITDILKEQVPEIFQDIGPHCEGCTEKNCSFHGGSNATT